ncbi:MAG TPA: PKD domain-containing protein [Pyrinomonadaceae bacterium]
MHVDDNQLDSCLISIASKLPQATALRRPTLFEARQLFSMLLVWILLVQTMLPLQLRRAQARSTRASGFGAQRVQHNDKGWPTRLALLANGWATAAVSSASSLSSPLEALVSSAATTGIAVVRQAPSINGNGRVEGSLRQLTGESVTLNGGAVITEDLQVPGIPALVLNGNPTFGGIIQGAGSPQPTNYQVTLNGDTTVLGHLVTRTDPISLANVPAPPASPGTRNVTITAPGQSAGDFATLQDLTLNGNVGMFTVPPGTYQNLTANGGSGFVFGISGATQPSTYNLSTLTLNGQSPIQILGPVNLTLGSGLTLEASIGSASNPAWLNLQVSSGSVTLNGGSSLYAILKAPAGTVIINGNSQLIGTMACDRLTVNGGGLLRLTESALPPVNQPPVVSAGLDRTITLPGSAALNGSVSDDGLPQGSSVNAGWSKVSGPGNVNFANAGNAVTTATFSQSGTYVLRLTASDSQLTNSSDVTITVIPQNFPPAVNAGPDGTTTLSAGATLNGSASDDGLPAGSTLSVIWSKVSGPGAVTFTNPTAAITNASFDVAGTYVLVLTASDSQLSSSDEVTITVAQSQHPPIADFHIPDNAGPVSLEVVSYSSVNGDSSTFHPKQLLDNSAATIWQSGLAQVTNQFVKFKTVDGQPAMIDHLRLQHSSASAVTNVKDFEIQISNVSANDADFTTVLSGTMQQVSSNFQEFSFPNGPVAARYLKLIAKNNYGSPNYIALATFQGMPVGGADNIISFLGETNAALSQSPVLAGNGGAIHNFSYGGGSNPDPLLDYFGGGWISNGVANQFATIQLAGGNVYTLAGVKLAIGSEFQFGNTTSVKDFEVWVSDTPDESAFTKVLSATATLEHRLQTFSFPGGPVAARYVKYVPLNNQGGGPNINTAIFDVIAAGRARVVEASGQNLAETDPPEAAFDDDVKSTWFSPNGVNTNVWVKTSLANETTHKVYGVRINPVNDNSSFPFGARDFEIRVSTTMTNDSAFTTVYTGTLQTANVSQEFLFAGFIDAKYVEFFWKNSYGSRIGVKELEVLAAPERGSALVGYSSSSGALQGPTNALDIDPTGSPWLTASGQNTNQWLKLLLPNAELWTIDHVALMSGGLFSDPGTAAKDFEVQVSTTDAADTSFSAICSGTLQNTADLQHFYFPPVQARYVRLLLKNNYGSSRIGLHIFYLYTPEGGSTSARFVDRSTAAVGRLVSWAWDFGDAGTSSEQNPAHEYAAPGSYLVMLTVTDDSGLTASHQLLYHAEPPLLADFAISPMVAHEGEESIRFTDMTRLLVQPTNLHEWDFADGSLLASFYAPLASHTFPDSGTYNVTLRLGADNGVRYAVSRQIQILNLAPSVVLDPGDTVVWGELWTSVPKISDPSPIDRQSLQGAWDFGDGQTSLCLNCNNLSGTVTHSYDLPGVYNATLMVTDKDGGIGSTTATYTVNKRPTLLTFVTAESEGGGADFLARARLVDAFANLSLVGKQVTFNLDGVRVNAVTSMDGIAEARFPISPGARIGLATVTFNEDDLYLGNGTAYTPPPSPDVHPTGTSSSKGTDFWLMFPENYFDGSGVYDVSINITSDTATTGTITLDRGSFPFTVAAHGTARVTLGNQDTVFLSNQIENKGIHVTSQQPVTVYGVNSRTLTGDAYLALPTNVLGTDHIILGYANGDVLQGSEFGIVAVTDETAVTITPAVTTGTRIAGVPYAITLNQGQTYMLSNEIAGQANDLSGSIITSSKPVAVFGGHRSASIPDGVAYSDHLVEQLPPTDTWGKHFVTLPFATRLSGDTFRFLAASDNTNIYLNGSRLTTLNRAQFYEAIIKAPSYVISDQPILIAQYSHGTIRGTPRGTFDASVGDPSMLLLPPFEQFLESYTVINLNLDGVSNQHINVVAPTTSMGNINLDGAPIPAARFAPIGSSAFSGAQLDTSTGVHNLTGPQPFGVSVYGFGKDFGYAYPGGINLVAAINGLPNQPPLVDAGPDQSITQPAVASLQGSALDDGLPANPLTVSWARVSGPGNVTFGTPNAAATIASFTAVGVYVLRLTASDPNFSASDDVQITVNAAPVNQPPTVDAGPDQTVVLHANLIANGGNESPLVNGEIPGWTEVQATTWTQGSVNIASDFPEAQRGAAYFYSGNAAQAELRQDVDLSAYAAKIAAGTQQLEFKAYLRSAAEALPDTGRVVVEYRNATNTSVIATLDSGPITSTSGWQLTEDTRLAPAGTGWIRVRLVAARNSGAAIDASNDVFFDSLSLRPVGAVPVKLSGVVADDGLPYGSSLTTTWDMLSGPGPVTFATPNAAVTGASFTTAGTYVLRLTASDGDGAVNTSDDITVIVNPANQAPVVSAGINQTITLPATAGLNGTVTDDGQPPGSSVSVSWGKVSGPGVVAFTNVNLATTTASFSAAGTYVLRLTADDTEYDTAANITITVNPEPTQVNQPPTVNPGPNQTISLPADTVTLNGTATDDGLPVGSTLTITWTKISGPGVVTFGNANSAVTTAQFSAPGTYVLRLSASDGAYLASADFGVILTPQNQAPNANAGADQTILLSQGVQLNGSAGDDGLPVGSSLTTTWTKVSGPGTVTFGNPNVMITGANFSASGTYVLRLTVSDSALSASDDLTITVNENVAPPTVEITAPADGSSVTEPAIVTGSVSDGAWQLECSLASDDNTNNRIWTMFASGSGAVSNGQLGTLDPSMMLNGLFTIRLSASDSYGQVSRTSTSVIVERNLKIGNFTISFSDLNIPVAGVPMEVTRTYDSRDKRVGDFGFGWTLGLRNIRLEKSGVLGFKWYETASQEVFPNYCLQATGSHVLTVTFPGGKLFKFEAAVTPQCQRFAPITGGTVSFTPLPGTHGILEVMGSSDFQVEGSIPGPVNLIGVGGGVDIFNSSLFKFTAEDGTAFIIDQRTGLQSVADTNNNTVTVSAAGIIHSSGGIQTRSITFARDSLGRISQITDPAGNAQTYAYDANGDLISYTDTENNTSTYTYDSTHRLLTIHDPRGIQPIRNEYDADGRLLSHIDGFGKVISYTHDLPSRVETITDRLGNPTSFEYDERGNVLRKTDARGGVTTFTYDANDNVLTETNALGNTTTHTYDAYDHRTSITDPLGNTTQFTYNALGKILTTTDALGHITTNTYNSAGNLLTTRDPLNNTISFTYSIFDGQRTSMTDALNNTSHYDYTGGYLAKETEALGNETTFTYDANGNRSTQTVKRTNAPGHLEAITTTYGYDKLNRLTKTTFADGSFAQVEYNVGGQQSATIDQLGHRTEFTYDDMGRLRRTDYPDATYEETAYDAESHRLTNKDRAGQVTSFTYDELGRLIKTAYAGGTFTTTSYDVAGQVLTTTDAHGNATHYEYDNGGRRTGVRNALNQETTFAYDAGGNQLSMTDALGHTTSYEYDLNNRRVKTFYGNSTFDAVGYDAAGRSVSKTDQAGKTTQFTYDALGRLTKVKDALNQETSYAYNELGQQISQTDANNHTTRFEYDRLGRRVKRLLPGGQFETYSYDNGGNLQSKTDFNGKTTTFTYDLMRRLLTKTPDVSFSQPTISFTYNTSGQRTTMSDASGITTYDYDVRNRLTSKQTPFGTLSYTYDEAGNLVITSSSNANGVSVDYSYDALNRLARVKDKQLVALNGGVTNYTYDTAGNLQSYSYPNGVTSSYAYNSLNRLTTMTVGTTASSLAGYSYTLGPAGNRTAVTELSGRTVNYTYDDLYRLRIESIANDPRGVNGTASYSYDPVGNRLNRSSSVAPVPSQTSTYDVNDRLTSDSYDSNGNTTAANSNSHSYDFENHLTSLNNGSVTYVYDGDGNRVAKTVAGVTTNYLIDTNNPTGYAQVVEELRAGSVVKSFTYGHDLISQRIVGSSLRFYGYDGHGSVRLLIDATGAVTDTYDYDAFGNLIYRTGTTPNDYLYSGEQFDANLGFYYLRARYMNPASGRFLSMDSFAGGQYDPLSLHKYLYANADPVNRVDPNGQFSLLNTVITSTVIGALSGFGLGLLTGGLRGAVRGAFQGAIIGALIPLTGAGVGYALLGNAARGIFIVGWGVGLGNAGVSGFSFATATTGEERFEAGVGLIATVAFMFVGPRALQYANTRTIAAEELNAQFLSLRNGRGQPPWPAGTQVTEITIFRSVKYVRVFTEGQTKPVGAWVMEASEIQGLSMSQIQQKFALPFTPTNITTVDVPAGSTIRIGLAGPNSFGPGGGMQVNIVD